MVEGCRCKHAFKLSGLPSRSIFSTKWPMMAWSNSIGPCRSLSLCSSLSLSLALSLSLCPQHYILCSYLHNEDNWFPFCASLPATFGIKMMILNKREICDSRSPMFERMYSLVSSCKLLTLCRGILSITNS